MTMTAEERRVLERWASKNVAVGAIHYPIKVLASVVLKQEAIRTATEPSASIAEEASND